MGIRAAFFDVGDTLVEHFAPRDEWAPKIRAALVTAFGERPWLDRFVMAEIEPEDDGTTLLQDTAGWIGSWFAGQGLACDVDPDALRIASVLPLEHVSTPVAGAAEAVRWCKTAGLAVILVTNTLYRGDAEILADWERAGLGPMIDGVVSSHSAGRRKPHPAMFERALALAGTGPADPIDPGQAVMVGDNPIADIRGAGQLGIRTVYRRTAARPLPAAIRPNATVDDLTTLPEVLRPWL